MQKLLLGMIVLLLAGFGALVTPIGASADYVVSYGGNNASGEFTFSDDHGPLVEHVWLRVGHDYSSTHDYTLLEVERVQTKDGQPIRNWSGWAFVPNEAFSQDGVTGANLLTTDVDLCMKYSRKDGTPQGCQTVTLSVSWVTNGFPTGASSAWTGDADGCYEVGTSDAGYSLAVATLTISLTSDNPITSSFAELSYANWSTTYTGEGCAQP